MSGLGMIKACQPEQGAITKFLVKWRAGAKCPGHFQFPVASLPLRSCRNIAAITLKAITSQDGWNDCVARYAVVIGKFDTLAIGDTHRVPSWMLLIVDSLQA